MSQEGRQHRRLKLTGLPAPARLFSANERRELSFRPVDVSKLGLGLFIAEALKVGSEVLLLIDLQEILLQIRWRADVRHDGGLFRYGLLALSDEVDLEELFFAHGCLEEDIDEEPKF